MISISCQRRFRFLALAIVFISAVSQAASVERSSEKKRAESAYASVTPNGKGAVASVNPIATQAGLDAFQAGGNAIDAALAVAFTLGVVDSHNSGIGGGCFIVVHRADGTILTIDGREMAPSAAHRDMFVVDGEVQKQWSKTGTLASGIPGSVAALHHLQKSSGKLSFGQVLLPAANVAEKGFAIDKVFAKRLSRSQKKIAKFSSSSKIFLDKNGAALKEGDQLVQKDLAKTYRRLAKDGPDYFYRGEFAKKTGKWMKANGGIITAKDFANYHIVERDAVRTTFLDHEIVGFPPPSSGGIHVSQMLNILERFDLEKLSEVERYHLIIEAMTLAFADRAYWLGDADFVDVPKGLIAKSYAAALAKKINLSKSSIVEGHSIPPNAETDLFTKHTTHIATADKEGNWVAITTTLNTSYGSKVVIPGTGVLMNNQMDDFSIQPGTPNAFGLVGAEANRVQAGKRPLSSMSPSIVLHKGKPVLTVGAAGGPTIISQVLQTIINNVALSLPLDEAMALARVHQQWRPTTTFIDGYASETLKKGLEARGHQLRVWPAFGATQAIAVASDGEFLAVTEPRLVSGNR